MRFCKFPASSARLSAKIPQGRSFGGPEPRRSRIEFVDTAKTGKLLVSGWVWGNVFFGGLIGLAIDAGTGNLHNIEPEHIQANLTKAK